jgi:toxin ParE1/3/4
MLRLKVRFRPQAVADIEEIFRFVLRASGSVDTAERFATRVYDRCRRTGLVPFGGLARDDLEKGLRIVPFEHAAVIAYQIEDDCVRITNVFYGGRDYDALYRREAPDEQADTPQDGEEPK